MRKGKKEIFISYVKSLWQSLKHTKLDQETKDSLDNEMYYFNNRRIVWIIGLSIIVELFNIINVIFFSKSGLSTINNRRYFLMYVLLLAGTVILAVVRWALKEDKKKRAVSYFIFVLFLAFWHAALTSIDIKTNDDPTVYVTAMFAIALLIRMRPWESCCVMQGSYLFFILTGDHITSGMYINTAVVCGVALMISCSRYLNTVEDIGYRQKLVQQNNRNLQRNIELQQLQERHKLLQEIAGDVYFEWNRKTDVLIFLENADNLFGYGSKIKDAVRRVSESGFIKQDDIHMLKHWIYDMMKERKTKDPELSLKNCYGSILRCHIKGRAQADENGKLFYIIGVISVLYNYDQVL